MSDLRVDYDRQHDVLYILVGKPAYGEYDEVAPGIYLRYEVDSENLLGAKVLDYSKKPRHALERLIRIDWKTVYAKLGDAGLQ